MPLKLTSGLNYSTYGAFIFVAINYFSKYVHSITPPNNEIRCITFFLNKYIFIRFSTPRAIIRDGGSHFFNRVFGALLDNYQLKHKVAMMYSPQTSGQMRFQIVR